jgi:zinc protease
MQLGEIVTAGLPPALLDGRVAKLRAITPAQVQAVARSYLVDDELTVGTLDPQPLVAKPPRPAVAGVRND